MKKWGIIFLFLNILSALISQEVLTYKEYIVEIEKKLPEIQQTIIQLEKARNAKNKSFNVYDVVLTSSFYAKGYHLSNTTNQEYDYSPGFGTSFGITSSIPGGTEITLSTEYAQTYQNGTSYGIDYTNTTYKPVLNIAITQPVLYNWFGFIDRYTIKDAKNTFAIESLKIALIKKNLRSYYKKLYMNWASYQELIKLYELTISNMKRLKDQTSEKAQIGLVEKDAYLNVNYNLIKVEQDYENLIFEYNKLLNELSIIINISDKIADTSIFDELFNLHFDKDLSSITFDKTSNAKIINLSKSKLKDLKKLKLNQTMPQLDLFCNIEVDFEIEEAVSQDETTYTAFYDGDHTNLDFTTGIELSFPIINKNARAQLKEAEIMLKDIVLEYEKSENQYLISLNNIINYHNHIKNSINLKEKGISQLNEIYKIERKKHRQGRLSLKDLLDTENEITNEKIALIKLRLNMIINSIDYELLIQ